MQAAARKLIENGYAGHKRYAVPPRMKRESWRWPTLLVSNLCGPRSSKRGPMNHSI